MAKRLTTPAPSALDPHHPLIRRLIRRVQLRERALLAGTEGAGDPWRLAHVGGLLVDVAQHIATARPRLEHDESAQLLLEFDGQAIGQLRRPSAAPDLLHPALEAAINRHLEGDDGREGDVDAEAEIDPDHVTVSSRASCDRMARESAALAKAVRL